MRCSPCSRQFNLCVNLLCFQHITWKFNWQVIAAAAKDRTFVLFLLFIQKSGFGCADPVLSLSRIIHTISISRKIDLHRSLSRKHIVKFCPRDFICNFGSWRKHKTCVSSASEMLQQTVQLGLGPEASVLEIRANYGYALFIASVVAVVSVSLWCFSFHVNNAELIHCK